MSRPSLIKVPTKQTPAPKQIDDSIISEGMDDAPLAWSWFSIEADLGAGTFGKVFKVKSIRNHRSSINKRGASNSIIKQNTRSIIGGSKAMKEIIQGNCYVIKEVDTAMMGQQDGLEALQEIEIIAELDSPFIVGYIDSFIVDTKINIIMEYCAHGDLEQFIKKQNGKPLIENFIWKVFIQICLGLQYLHSKGIVHRDLKSLNIFMSKDNSARIGDLGGARRMQSSSPFDNEGLESLPEESPEDATPVYKKVGTPFFAPPEVWEEKELNKYSDIWSLGVILYHMSTLQFPFVASNIDELIPKVLKDKPNQMPNTVKRELQEIIGKCLQKKPENRPSIEGIILSQTFQIKAKLCKISLPPELNQDKLDKLKAKLEEQIPMHSARPSTSGTAMKSTMDTFQRTNSQTQIGFGVSRTGAQQISVGNLSETSEGDYTKIRRTSNSFCGQSMLKQFQSGAKEEQRKVSSFKRQQTMSQLNDSTVGRNSGVNQSLRKLSGTQQSQQKHKPFGMAKRSTVVSTSKSILEDSKEEKKKPSLIKKFLRGFGATKKDNNGSQTTRHADIDRTPAKGGSYLVTPSKKSQIAQTPGLKSKNIGMVSNRPSMGGSKRASIGGSSNPSRTQSMYMASSKKSSSPFDQLEKQSLQDVDLDKLLLDQDEVLDKLLNDNQLGVLLEDDGEECLLVDTLEDDPELDRVEIP